jgi:RNA polymerase sigma-70 factor (ECF subfamily)
MTTGISRLSFEALQSEVEEAIFPPEEPSAGGSILRRLQLALVSDEELMRRLQSGEADTLTVLFKRHSQIVFRVASRILRDEAEAEDVVQQVFLEVFRARAQFDADKGSFRSWLFTIAYHRTFSRRKHLEGNSCYGAEELSEVLPAPLASMEAAVLLEEGLRRIHPRQRRTIELVYYEGLTAEEAAARTGESVRVVRHNLYRGMDKLRSFLAPVRETRSKKEVV